MHIHIQTLTLNAASLVGCTARRSKACISGEIYQKEKTKQKQHQTVRGVTNHELSLLWYWQRLYSNICTCMFSCVCLCVCMHKHSNICTCMFSRVLVCVCVCACMCVRACMCVWERERAPHPPVVSVRVGVCAIINKHQKIWPVTWVSHKGSDINNNKMLI